MTSPSSVRRFLTPAIALLWIGVTVAGRAGQSGGPPFVGNPAAVGTTAPAIGAGTPSFDEVWHDGRAELCGYRLTVDRYGKPRSGRAVLITVTEPFSRSRHVKVEDPSKNPADVFEALKVNLVRRFQTGIYDYQTMVSLFTDASTLEPVKVAFSASEWCGQVSEETLFAEGETRASISSYFEDESARVAIPTPAGGVVEDELYLLLRGLREPFLAPGERRERPFLASPFFRRLAHRRLVWSSVSIERLPKSERVRVPAGTFTASVYAVRTEDGREGRFHIEDGPARRILRWAWTRSSHGATRDSTLGGTDRGELTGSARLAYWKLHDPGDEKHLRELGLTIPLP
jgi:hypothetical protein